MCLRRVLCQEAIQTTCRLSIRIAQYPGFFWAGCNLRTAACPPRGPRAALRRVSASHQGKLGLFQLQPYDLTSHGLQHPNGMKAFCLCLELEWRRCLRVPLACSLYEYLNKWPKEFCLSPPPPFWSGFLFFSPPPVGVHQSTRPEASPYRARGELPDGGTGSLPVE